MAQPNAYRQTESLPSLFGGEVDFVTRKDAKEVRDYDSFTKKFEPKLTTDDCLTPPAVYDAVLGWACGRCGIDPTKTRIIRPFKHGGDYLAEDYSGDCAVIDNPPFSILSKIMRNYLRMGVRFFLFAPHLTLFSSNLRITRIATCNTVTYDNGAKVSTSFVTDMLGDIAVMTAPDLYRAVKAADKDREKKEMPKYAYPDELVTSARLGTGIARFVPFELSFDEVSKVTALDSMGGKGIYGGGFLIPEGRAAELRAAELRAAELRAAELRAAELRAAHRWPLSERERAVIAKLGRKSPAVAAKSAGGAGQPPKGETPAETK